MDSRLDAKLRTCCFRDSGRWGRPLPGFALADCRGLVGDAIDQVVFWASGADVGSLAGRAVRLRFVMSEADLYALRFV